MAACEGNGQMTGKPSCVVCVRPHLPETGSKDDEVLRDMDDKSA